MTVHIETVLTTTDIDCETLKRIGEKVLQDQSHSGWVVSVAFVDDSYIQQLNKTYLNRDRPTDVLAFPIDEYDSQHKGPEKILGDIYISLDRAKEQSVDYQVSLDEEIARLMLHGLFHLLGYSHEDMSPLVEGYLSQC